MDDDTPERLDEAGRVLSRKNAERLRAALAEIAAVLDEADPTEARESRRALPLAEARNVAEWFEASIHRDFTNTADYMFGEGRLTRDERIALSGAIGAALDAFRGTLAERAPGLYGRDPYKMPDGAYAEAKLHTEPVALKEAAVAADGSVEVCLITPGWGSSGYYPAEVLRRDGPQIFRAGTQMFLDHPTASEESERPERSVRDLAATLTGDARWQERGWNGPGLYAPARVVETERPTVDALAPYIGVSIRASGYGTPGEAEGRKGLIVERLTAAHSVDFVTVPGRGGAVRVLAEAARRLTSPTQETPPMSDKTETPDDFREAAVAAELKQLREAVGLLQQQNAAQARALTESQGRELITRTLAATEALPELARVRIAGAVRPVLTEAGALDTAATLAAVESAVEAEIAYLNQIAGPGRIRGLGISESRQDDPAKLEAELAASLADLGLSEGAAKIAAKGRI